MTALGFPSAAYDRWKTTEPQRRAACDVCSEALGLEPGDTIRIPGEDDLVCSYRCQSVWDARNAATVEDCMQAIADAMSAGADLELHARLAGGGREVRGTVVDWDVDGLRLVVEDERGQERHVRRDDVREIEVV